MQAVYSDFLAYPLREPFFMTITQDYLQESLFPIITLAQISIGVFYAQQINASIKKHRGLKKSSEPPVHKGNVVADFIGSPQTSALSLIAYYITGSYSSNRLTFVTEEIYAFLYHGIPDNERKYLLAINTVIPYFYPCFKNQKVKNNAYTRCHQALYESWAAMLLQKSGDALLYESVCSAAIQYEKHEFIKRCQISLTSTQKKAFLNFHVIVYISKKQLAFTSQIQTTFQLTIPRGKTFLSHHSAFEGIVELIAKIKPERIVIYQKRASLLTHLKAVAFALNIHTLRTNDSGRFQVDSIAYHNENPKEPIPNVNWFYCVFSEICTMGYNNPNQMFNTPSSEKLAYSNHHQEQKCFIESYEQSLKKIRPWRKTIISHTNLKRPPFKWEYLKNTFIILFLHEFFFQAGRPMSESLHKANHSKKIIDIFKSLFACYGLLSKSKWALHFFLLPIRIVFALCGACYLYGSAQSDSIFDKRSKPYHNNMITVDTFSIKEVCEEVLIYDEVKASHRADPSIFSPVKKKLKNNKLAKKK